MPALDKLPNFSAFKAAVPCTELKPVREPVQVGVNPSPDMEPILEQDSDSGFQLTVYNGDVEREGIREFEEGEEEMEMARALKPCEEGNWKIEKRDSDSKSSLPFLCKAPKTCLVCQNVIYNEEILCSVRSCQAAFHLICAKDGLGFLSSKQFKCPQHACFLCKQKNRLWRCIRCPMASHDKCAPFPEHVIRFPDRPQEVICWRHPTDWHLEKKQEVPARSLEEIFSCLPLPHKDEEFEIDLNWKDLTENTLVPPPYEHIKRSILCMRKRSKVDADTGCASCSSTECSEACVCRVQCISCSKGCLCKGDCKNRPFRKEKKIQLVKTEHCGWGVVAAESINKGDFVIEYVGEVIDDALCEKRLWEMKDQEVQNFYMCEIRKDFVIDATFKGNSSRFLNHSCAPNCKLEKWQVDGEIRVGVFAARSIQVGEPLTYDYRFEQFGPEVECRCGAENCQGNLGTKKKVVSSRRNKRKTDLNFSWGARRQRSSQLVYENN
ncbi:histone-lysine N-methyltransferase ASHR3 isoform X2 [Olea europaea var. sylvestris]|uniref:histone-lysine N-methyltransferase ASHR3 isoform X2 n=1 Tax=Olea europaea var. sylvestris TaxID=158386 RepID=UPI000C1D6E32|nr:histone-lysine N-methyltransferase ASHR3 isoform X2 [Olea europaea var. sylvestris]